MTLPRARPSAVGSDLIPTAVASRNADRDRRRRRLRRTCRFADSALLNGTIPDQRLYEHISLVAAWWIHARRPTGLDRPARLGAMAASHRRPHMRRGSRASHVQGSYSSASAPATAVPVRSLNRPLEASSGRTPLAAHPEAIRVGAKMPPPGHNESWPRCFCSGLDRPRERGCWSARRVAARSSMPRGRRRSSLDGCAFAKRRPDPEISRVLRAFRWSGSARPATPSLDPARSPRPGACTTNAPRAPRHREYSRARTRRCRPATGASQPRNQCAAYRNSRTGSRSVKDCPKLSDATDANLPWADGPMRQTNADVADPQKREGNLQRSVMG